MKKNKSPKRIKRDNDLDKLKFLFLGNQKNGALAHNELFRLAYASIFNQTALIDDDQIRLIPDQEKKTDQKRLNRKYIYDLFNDLTKRFPVDYSGKFGDKTYHVKSKSWLVGNEKNIISQFLSNYPVNLGNSRRKGLSIASVVRNFEKNKDLIPPTSDNRSSWDDGRPPIGPDLVARWRSGALAPIKRYRQLLVLIIYNWYVRDDTGYRKYKYIKGNTLSRSNDDFELAQNVFKLSTILDGSSDLDNLDPLNIFSVMVCSLKHFIWLHDLKRAIDFNLNDKECINYLKFIHRDIWDEYSDTEIRNSVKYLRLWIPKIYENQDMYDPSKVIKRKVLTDPITYQKSDTNQFYLDDEMKIKAGEWLQKNIPMVFKQIEIMKEEIKQIKIMQKDFQYIGGK